MTWRLISSLLLRRADWREDVSAYMDDELSPRDRARVEAQLAESTEMQEYLADLKEMRSVLLRFDPEPSAVPFQLTTDMLNDPSRVAATPSSTARALRLSMSTAAVGVATFAAVMVFDAVDSPTVNFTTTAADDQAARVPTAAVVTDQVEVAAQPQRSSSSGGEQAAGRPESAVAAAGEAQDDEEEVVTVTAVAASQEQEAAEEIEEEAEAAVEQAQQQAEEGAEEQAAKQAADEAASDPSRRALTAGRGSGLGDTRGVRVEGVVAQQQEDEEAGQAMADSSEAESQTAGGATGDQQAQDETAVAASSSPAVQDEQQTAAETETRSVATSIARGESDWPLEQRPRSSTVQLASDPSWERPVQIVLAAIAISATVFWLVLTIVDRRRRA
jgi:hypothetical protein